MLDSRNAVRAATAWLALHVAGCGIGERPSQPDPQTPDAAVIGGSTDTLIAPKRSAARPVYLNLADSRDPQPVKAFAEAIAPYLPKDGDDLALDPERLKGLLSAACKHLGDIEVPKYDSEVLVKINEALRDRGFRLGLSISTDGQLDEVSVLILSGEKTAVDTSAFQPLLNLTPSSPVDLRHARERVLFSTDEPGFSVKPGRVYVDSGDKESLAVVLPEEISKQGEIFRREGIAISEESLWRIVCINEAAHVLLDRTIGREPFEVQLSRMRLDDKSTMTIPPFNYRHFQEIVSDGATLLATEDFPAAIVVLGRQQDEQHIPSVQILTNAIVFAIDRWASNTPSESEKVRRGKFVRSIVTLGGDGGVRLDLPELALELQKNPALLATVRDTVGSVYRAVVGSAVQKLTKSRLQ